MDSSLVPRGRDRAPVRPLPSLALAVDGAPRPRPLRGVAVPRRRPQPDEHGQPLRVRPLDLPRPHGHRARRGRLLHGLPALRDEEEGAEGGHQQRGRDRLHLLLGGDRDPRDRRRTAAAGVVHLLAPERPLDADRGHLLPDVLPQRARDRVPPARPEEPEAAEGPVDARLRVRAAQGDGGVRARRHVPVLLPPGLARRALRRSAGPAVRVPRVAGRVADDLLPVHPLRGRRRAELRHRHHLARVEAVGPHARAARGVPAARARSRGRCSSYTCSRRASTRSCG